MDYKRLVLKSPTTGKILKLPLYKTEYYNQNTTKEAEDTINKFFSDTDDRRRALGNWDLIILYKYDNMYFEDEKGNLISLEDYINMARMIGPTRKNWIRETEVYSQDTINGSIIEVYCHSRDIESYGSIKIVCNVEEYLR